MDLSSKKLLHDLLETTQENLTSVEVLKNLPMAILNWKQDPESWSILECIEHLNRYGDFYIPEITHKIEVSTHEKSEVFKSNWLGRYFSTSIAYNEDLKTMKTFKSMNPINSILNIKTLDTFIHQQLQIIELLEKAKNINLDKTKTVISISKLIKLKLGDTFRVVIYHNERHVKQAEKVLKQAKIKKALPM